LSKFRLAVAASVLAMSLAHPGSAGAQAPTGDSVVGSGHVLLTDFTVSIQAGPNGERPTGSLTLSGFLNLTATPTCLDVSGSAAVGGYRIDDGPQAGQGFLAAVVDNGPPMGGQPVDTLVYSGLLPAPPTTCPTPGDPPPPELLSTGGGTLTTGDIVVVDAPALPTSKAQCRHGGWRTFGVFGNQGDCVSFVATEGRNPPGAP
jgi:hypothetical protein